MTTQQMLAGFRRAITEYKMIKEGDKIAVGLSGGKDSVTLLKLLSAYQTFSPEKFSLAAVTVDLGFANADFTALAAFCEQLGVPYTVVKTDIGEVVFGVRKESNPCALCAKMRKGALNAAAKENGCNKVALGHHADDFIETMLLSFFYEGRLSTMQPKALLDRTGVVQIRPMMFLEERDIKSYAKTLPVCKSCCPADKATKREYVKSVIDGIKKEIPFVRERMFSALTHPERYNLFDKFQKEIDLF
ncbi:MAG: tRNA 2-thiocytidine(32) synthetase TtcA [Bacillota bacterium]|nr:MAG: tRNA 2-thiocytidine(32) synthetase TtcA [Bacillota bacterium]